MGWVFTFSIGLIIAWAWRRRQAREQVFATFERREDIRRLIKKERKARVIYTPRSIALHPDDVPYCALKDRYEISNATFPGSGDALRKRILRDFGIDLATMQDYG